MTGKTPKTFGLVIKHNVAEASKIAAEVSKWLKQKNCDCIVADESKNFISANPEIKSLSKKELVESSDMIIVFGGDGTFLGIAREMVKTSIPILGINMGQLGFLTEIKVQEIYDTLEQVLVGDYQITKRSMLEACVMRKGKELISLPVLNDATITKSSIARIIDFSLKIDKTSVANVKSDGLIVSTPTGSTAYSLAAGGPIIHPQVASISVTAICPHSLTFRPIVIPDSSELEIELEQKDGEIMLTLDGQFGYNLEQGDLVRVHKFERHPIQIVRSSKRDYFELLRTKLNLGARGPEA